MAAGNRHLAYKERPERARAVLARHRRRRSSQGFFERGRDRFAGDEADPAAAAPLRRVRRAHPGRGVRVLPAPRPGRRAAVTRPFAPGERVLLLDTKRRRHLVTLAPGGEFHSHAGVLRHDDVLGHEEGVTVRTTLGARLIAVRPTLGEYVLEMPRGAQVIYPKDLGPILMLADIFPGAQILESGVGSGALTMTLLRADRPGRARHRLRAARGLRRPGPTQRRRAPRHRPAAAHRGPRRLRRHRRGPTSTGSSSTCPSRGAWS